MKGTNELLEMLTTLVNYILKFLWIFIKTILCTLALYLTTAMLRGPYWAEKTWGGLIDKIFKPLNRAYKGINNLPDDMKHKIDNYDNILEKVQKLQTETQELQKELASKPPTDWSWD